MAGGGPVTRPDDAAVVMAGFLGLDAAIAWACGAPWVAAVLLAMAAGAAALFWHVPSRDDMCDLIEATREANPHFTDWDTRELTQ